MTPTPNELERLLIELRHSAHANASLSGKPVTDQVEWLALHKIEQLEAQNKRYAEALTPSAETKAAYIGEFSIIIDEQYEDAVCEVTRKIDVPWTMIKEIMAAIRSEALNPIGGSSNSLGSPDPQDIENYEGH